MLNDAAEPATISSTHLGPSQLADEGCHTHLGPFLPFRELLGEQDLDLVVCIGGQLSFSLSAGTAAGTWTSWSTTLTAS